ncbi:MAG: D-2-hydroxyacid dehydrogenase family protein, partial [Hyphomicrobiales bacterium]
DDYQNAALGAADWSSLPGHPGDMAIRTFDTHLGHDENRIAETLAPFDIIVAMRERTPFPASLIARLPNLKLLVTTGMRNLAIDMAAARERGIDVCGTSVPAYPAAEHAMALILELFKKISSENAAMHAGKWQTVVAEGLSGKTLGLLGLGRLGDRVARFGKALDMDVIAWSQNMTPERAAEAGATHVARDELFARSDVLSIHLVLSDRTRGLVGARELDLMKPTAYLVNTSRGPIVDEKALIETLTAKRIAGAGIDVFDVEPLPRDHPLRKLDNAVLTGHTGYVVKEFFRIGYGEAVEDIAAWMAGKPIRLLNPAG